MKKKTQNVLNYQHTDMCNLGEVRESLVQVFDFGLVELLLVLAENHDCCLV